MEDTGKSMRSWLGYGVELLTLFFAIAVLAGRVYAQSYWKVFGLSPELVETTFINYAIISPNIAVASVLMATSTIVLLAYLRGELPDFVGDSNPRVISFIGLSVLFAGIFFITLMLIADTSAWTSGVAGLVFGLGYLGFIGGLLIYSETLSKLEKKEPLKKEPPKWRKAISGWLKSLPKVLVMIFFIVLFAATAVWSIVDTAKTFGANEAKFMYNTRPIVAIQLDSSKGFEDIALVLNPNSVVISNYRIITEAGGFLYIARLTENQSRLNVRAVPVSRVQAIQYNVVATPIGE